MTNKPIENFYAGNVEVAVWENRGEDSKVFHTVTAKRTYMDGNGQWKDAGTVQLLPQQIPDMLLALQKSHEFLRMGMRQRRKQQSSNELSGQSREESRPEPSHESEPAAEKSAPEGADQGFAGRVIRQRGERRSR